MFSLYSLYPYALDAPHSSIQPEPSLELVQLLGSGLIRVIRPCCGSFRSGGPARCGLRLGQRRLRSIASCILIEGMLSAEIGSSLSVSARRTQLAGALKRIVLHVLLRLEVLLPVIVLIYVRFSVFIMLVFSPSIPSTKRQPALARPLPVLGGPANASAFL